MEDPELRKFTARPGDHEIVAPIILGYPRVTSLQSEKKEPQILKIIS